MNKEKLKSKVLSDWNKKWEWWFDIVYQKDLIVSKDMMRKKDHFCGGNCKRCI